MKPAWAFIKLSRLHFLIGGVVMYAVGAISAGVESAGTYLLGQGLVTFAQLTAHYVNEYADTATDRFIVNRTLFSGGSGVLGSGGLAPSIALRAAQTTTLLTFGVAALAFSVSPGGAALGLLSLGVSWAYSMPPWRLLDTGWGELATSMTVAGSVPAIGALVNGGPIVLELLWLVAALVPIHMAMMVAFELPDLDSDRAAGKMVLAVRIGPVNAQRLIAALFGLAAAVGVLGTLVGDIDVTVPLAAAGLPALVTVSAARRARHALLTAAAVATFVVFAVGVLILR